MGHTLIKILFDIISRNDKFLFFPFCSCAQDLYGEIGQILEALFLKIDEGL